MLRLFTGLLLLGQLLLTSPIQGQCMDSRNDFCGVHPYANLKLGVNLIPLSKAKSGTHLNISASLGLMLPKNNIQPNLLFTATFLRGDIGTSIIPVGKPDIRFEGMLTIAASWSGGNPLLEDPFTTMGRTFHIGSSAMLWLPQTKALSLGTHFVFSKNSTQQVGFLHLKVQHDLKGGHPGVMLHYYNDGIPYHLIGLGDAFDRWWTGGGNIEAFYFDTFFSKNNADRQFKYSLNAGFDKFTGGGKTAINDPFKFANHILLKDVDYAGNDYNEIFFNRGVFFVGFGVGRFLFEFDVPIVEIDVQDIIHKIRIDSYHPKYENRKENLFRYLRYSFVPRVLF